MNRQLPDVQAGFGKGRGSRDQIANICWIIEKARQFQKKTSISDSLTMLKAFEQQTGKFLQRIRIPDHFRCLLRNLYARQEATVRTRDGKMD